MAVINYELNDDIIITESGRLQLEELNNKVIFYSSFDINANADINIGDSTPIENSGATLAQINAGRFSKGLSLRSTATNAILYKKENFVELTDKGSISFWVNFYNLGDTFTLLDLIDTNDINNVTNNDQRIQLIYDGVGWNLKMNGDSDNLIVNDTSDTFVSGDTFQYFELNWNRSLYQLFINGAQEKLGRFNFVRTNNNALIFGSKENSNIAIDELIVKNTYGNFSEYTVPNAAYTKYPASNPYQDIPIGDSFAEKEVEDIIIEGSENLKFYLQSGDTFFKVINREWIDATDSTNFQDSNNIDEIRNNIASFPFDSTKEIKFRVFFPSNGFTQAYLDKIEINKIEGAIISKDYSRLITYAKAKLGAPIMPVELTDQQFSFIIEDTKWNFHRYRNRKEEVEIFDLEGSYSEGWMLPEKVKEKNVIDIVVEPIVPFGYYPGKGGLLSNLYLQYLFQVGGTSNISSNIADYRISLSVLKDFSILLGTQVKWEILGGKLRIWPEPPAGSKIGLRYLQEITPENVENDYFFRALLLAESKILLGTIRSTFVGGIPGGEANIQLNGESLIAEGKQEKQEIMEQMKRSQQPLFLDFF